MKGEDAQAKASEHFVSEVVLREKQRFHWGSKVGWNPKPFKIKPLTLAL